MCRLLAYSGQPVPIEDLLLRPAASLIVQSHAARQATSVVNADGCGVGWFGHRPEPGVYRGILPAWSDANLASICRQISSRLFFAHVRAATSGDVAIANCHPFSAGRHLFMHNGDVGNYGRLRRRVDALIPDALYQLRRGTCDSEAIFLAALGRGLDTDPSGAFAATLGEILDIMRGAGCDGRLSFSAVHSDGERMWAYRWASDARPPPSLYWRRLPEGVVVASEPFDEDDTAWSAIPPQACLEVGGGTSPVCALRPFGESLHRPRVAA